MEISRRIQRWFGTAGSAVAGSVDASLSPVNKPGLAAIRTAMAVAMSACTERHRLRAAFQIELAASPVELWLLRADIFQYLAQDLGQKVAAQEVMRLDPLFKGLVPGAETDHEGRHARA